MGTLYFRVVTNPAEPFSAEGMTRWPGTTPDPNMENLPDDKTPDPNPTRPYDDQLRDQP